MVELIWDGKYDANSKRTAAQQRQLSLDLLVLATHWPISC